MTSIRLRLLDQVTWDGQPLTSDRAQALLAALALAGRAVSDGALADAVWGEEEHVDLSAGSPSR